MSTQKCDTKSNKAFQGSKANPPCSFERERDQLLDMKQLSTEKVIEFCKLVEQMYYHIMFAKYKKQIRFPLNWS